MYVEEWESIYVKVDEIKTNLFLFDTKPARSCCLTHSEQKVA